MQGMRLISSEWHPPPLLLYLETAVGGFGSSYSSSPSHSAATSTFRKPTTTIPTTAAVTLISTASSQNSLFNVKCRSSLNSSDINSTTLCNDEDDDNDDDNEADSSAPRCSYSNKGIEIEIEKIGSNCRRIRSKIVIEASLQTVWDILTDYERLADFIPGLALSQLLEKRDNFARLFQIGQQNLAFGLKFNAKGIIDCFEKDLESLPSGKRRDIEFKMVEGDFQLFEGRWSVEECNTGRCKQCDALAVQEFHTTLSYVVDVEPKLWLPVSLVEGKLCRQIKMNLSCIREESQRTFGNMLSFH